MKVLLTLTILVCGAASASVENIQVISGTVARVAPAADGTVYVTGSGFIDPTPGAYINRRSGDYVVHIDPRTWDILYATYVGLTVNAIAVDSSGSVYVAGQSTLKKLNPTGTGVEFDKRFGGTGVDYPIGLALGPDGSVYITGNTNSTNFPATPGAIQSKKTSPANSYDAFFLRLSSDGANILYSTYLGGAKASTGLGVAVDAMGNAHIAGITNATDFPATPGALATPFPSDKAVQRAFFARWSPSSGTFDYIGSVGYDVSNSAGPYVAADAKGRTVLAGNSTDGSMPGTAGSFQPGISGPWILMLNEIGSDLVYSSGLGARTTIIRGLSLDSDGNPILVGSSSEPAKAAATIGAARLSSPASYGATYLTTSEVFAAKLSSTGSRLVYLTYADLRDPSSIYGAVGANTIFIAARDMFLTAASPGINIHASFAATAETPESDRRSTLSAITKALDLCNGSSLASLYWDTRDQTVEAVEVHFGAPDGPLVSSGLTGSTTVPPADGATYYLQNVTGGKPLTSDNTLAVEQLSAHRLGHCSAVAEPTLALRADPNPVLACAEDGGFTGTETAMYSPGDAYNELHYESPDGIQLAAGSGFVSLRLGDWVRDSTDFFLTDGKGKSFASERVYVLPIRWCRLGAPTPSVITTRCGQSGATTLVWHAGVRPVEIRAGSPDGPTLARFDQAQGLFDPPAAGKYHLMGYQSGAWRPLASVAVNGMGCGQ